MKIGIIHKGQLTSENTDDLGYLAKKTDFDVLIFEHFHHRIAIRPKYSCATVPGIAEPSAIELEITERNLKGQIIRCSGNVCSYFEYEKP